MLAETLRDFRSAILRRGFYAGLLRFRFFGKKVLFAKPNPHRFGHLGLETLFAFRLAEEEGAILYLEESKDSVSSAIYSLQCFGVKRIPRKGMIVSILKGIRYFHTLLLWGYFSARYLRAYLRWKRSSPKKIKRVEKDIRNEIKVGSTTHDGHYFQRRLISIPCRVGFLPQLENDLRRQAKQIGLDSLDRIVTLHIRESGFWKDHEVHPAGKARIDSTRNAQIESYDSAVDWVVSQGYQVVRIGDPTMTPFVKEGVIDLATSKSRTPELELFLIQNSYIFWGCESGPNTVALLLGVPSLIVNATDPVASFPVREKSAYLLKKVTDRESGKKLGIEDLLSSNYLNQLRDADRFIYSENNSDELLDAVKEMFQLVKDSPEFTVAQQAYKENLLHSILKQKEENKFIKKWGDDSGFLGNGRILNCNLVSLKRWVENS